MKKRFWITLFVMVNTASGFTQELHNAIRLLPMGVNEIGLTVGMEYERFSIKNPRFSFIAPIEVVFERSGWDYYRDKANNPYFFFRPGAKFYTAKKERVVKYAVGMNAIFGYGKVYEYIGYSWDDYDPNQPYPHYYEEYTYKNMDNFRVGMNVTNYLHLDITKNITVGAHLGLGLLYINRLKGSNKRGEPETIHFGTSLGFRF